FADAGGVMITQAPLVKSRRSWLQPWLLRVSELLLNCARPASRCAPGSAFVTASETPLWVLVGQLHMPIVWPLAAPSLMAIESSWGCQTVPPTVAPISAGVSNGHAGTGLSAP